MYFILSTFLSTFIFPIAALCARAEPPIMCDLQHKFFECSNILNLENSCPTNYTLMQLDVPVVHTKYVPYDHWSTILMHEVAEFLKHPTAQRYPWKGFK